MCKLNPRVDFAFKKLFGSEENKDILISFINSIVSPADRVKDVSLINPYNNAEFKGDKISILDIKAIDETGRHYNIEMQIVDEIAYDQRALYYWSRLYTNQLKEGYKFTDLKKTISIHVLNFSYFNDEENYHNVFRILNTRSHKTCFEDFEMHFIELEKFDKELSALKTTLDRWVKFLKKADVYSYDKIPAELAAEQAIEKAIKALDTMYLSDAEREIYEAQLKWLRDEASAVYTAHEKGIAQGKAEGKAEGKIEQQMIIAKRLLTQKLDAALIAEVTGLALEQITALK